MKISRSSSLPLDKFIELALYDKNFGYYMKKNPFGIKGDFVTAPNITRLFSEIIGIWSITFWKSIGSPKKFNLLELGAGNGEMMKVITETLKNFPEFFKACNFMIYEKSKFLINEQKKNLEYEKITWIKNLKKINSYPTLFLANEFFDAIPIKQFFKKKETWFERHVKLKDLNNARFIEKKANINNIKRIFKFDISKNQNIIEYSPKTFGYLKTIFKIVEKNDGGILIIDYGYLHSKMHDTLQAVAKHKYSDICKNIGNSDITHNINFNLFKIFTNQFHKLDAIITSQKKFLLSMGILQRAEVISKNIAFSKKADLFYRIKRLVDKKQMGELFKVMLIKNRNNKFNTGFQSD
mgnify:CR=1 FL=1|tara:strand:- start:745 stop:1800 length:1056 start_codon:yes stop_codon:yes gene_type:complete